LLNKLKKSADQKILAKIKSLKNLKIKIIPKNQADFFTHSKFRIVDPYFIKNNKLIKVSLVDKNYRKKINQWANKAKKDFWIKILNS